MILHLTAAERRLYQEAAARERLSLCEIAALYFVAGEHLLRFGVAGIEVEVDCSFAANSWGVACASWDVATRTVSLSYAATMENGEFRVVGATNHATWLVPRHQP